jgi:hypothetical protein
VSPDIPDCRNAIVDNKEFARPEPQFLTSSRENRMRIICEESTPEFEFTYTLNPNPTVRVHPDT